MSVELLYDLFQEFSKASGLVANKDKSSIYIRGVPIVVQQEILQMLRFTEGVLPIRYLGVLLSTKRISIAQCQPLIEKILHWIQSWTLKFLSCAERIQLVKRVLFSVQIFWAQIFMFPIKVIKCIETACRKFLWTREVDLTHKALVTWNTLCKPKIAWGLNFLDILC